MDDTDSRVAGPGGATALCETCGENYAATQAKVESARATQQQQQAELAQRQQNAAQAAQAAREERAAKVQQQQQDFLSKLKLERAADPEHDPEADGDTAATDDWLAGVGPDSSDSSDLEPI